MKKFDIFSTQSFFLNDEFDTEGSYFNDNNCSDDCSDYASSIPISDIQYDQFFDINNTGKDADICTDDVYRNNEYSQMSDLPNKEIDTKKQGDKKNKKNNNSSIFQKSTPKESALNKIEKGRGFRSLKKLTEKAQSLSTQGIFIHYFINNRER